MSSSVYFHCVLKNVSAKDEDLVTQFCFDYGAGGVSEELQFHQMKEDYQPEIIEAEDKTLNVFFELPPDEEFLLKLQSEFKGLQVSLHQEQNRDWLEEWKKGYKPFCLAGDYWVVPTWLEKPDEAETAIWIDPGMAFGTGTHATTQMAAQLLCGLFGDLKSSLDSGGLSVLDVGTGTGILAFLTSLEGASLVHATEIDQEARRVTRENQKLNTSATIEVLEHQVDVVTEKYDIVIANIIDGVLRKIKSDLVRCLKPGGHLVLSGILVENEKEFLQEFLADTQLEVIQRKEKEEWLGLVLH